MKAHIVQPEDIVYIWEQVAPLLDRVKEHSEGELETDDFLEFTGSDDEKWMFHYISDTAVFTQQNGITQVLYPTIYEKYKRILRGIDSEEVTV